MIKNQAKEIGEKEEIRLKRVYYTGDNEPVGNFCTNYRALLLFVAYRSLKNIEDRYDVYQDVALDLCKCPKPKRPNKLPLAMSAKAILIKLTRNKAIDFYRKLYGRTNESENSVKREKAIDFTDTNNPISNTLKDDDWLEKQITDENNQYLITQLKKELNPEALEFFTVFSKDVKSMDLIKEHYHADNNKAKAMKQKFKRKFRIKLKQIIINQGL